MSESDYKTQIRQIGTEISSVGNALVPVENKIVAEKRKLATPEELQAFDDTISKLTTANQKILAMVPPDAFKHRHELVIRFADVALNELKDERENFKRGDGSLNETVKKDIADEKASIADMQAEDKKIGFSTEGK